VICYPAPLKEKIMQFQKSLAIERNLFTSQLNHILNRNDFKFRACLTRRSPCTASSRSNLKTTNFFYPKLNTKRGNSSRLTPIVAASVYDGAEISYAIPSSNYDSKEFDKSLRESFFKVAETDEPEVLNAEVMRRVMDCTPTLKDHIEFEEGELDYLRERYVDESGKLSYGAFKELAMRAFWLSNKAKEFKHAFMLADLDNDGVLKEREVAMLFKDMGHPFSPPEVTDFIKEADTNANGALDLREFMLMAVSGTLDVAEVLAYRAIASGPSRIGMPKSVRRKMAIQQMRQLMLQQWDQQYNESNLVAHEELKVESEPQVASPPDPVVEEAKPDPDAFPVTLSSGSVTLAKGVVNSIHGGGDLQSILERHPDMPMVLMVGFTFCRPCKAFKRTYEKMAAYYTNVAFLFVYGNESEDTKHLVKNVLKLKVSPMFYCFRGMGESIEPVASHSGARDYKLVDAFIPFLNEGEIPKTGHYPTTRPDI